MKVLYTSAIRHLSIACILVLLACLPTSAKAQFYYEDYYYADEYYYDGAYYSYESNVQDAFAAQNPTASSPSQIKGRQNLWDDDGYDDDENLHPADPLPIGDSTILFVMAAIAATIIFIQQRKHKQQMKQLSTHKAHKILLLIGFLFLAGQSFAWKPIMIGHRGCSMGVENTEEAFLNAIKVYGFQALECDVKMTKDLVPVCWHDDNLSKGSHNYAIASTNLATLQAEKLTQTRNGTTYTGYICTLDRYMEICRDYNVIPVVELKYTTGITNTGDISNFDKIYNVIQKYGMEDRTIILYADADGLKNIRTDYPNLRCQHLVNNITQDKLANAKNNGWDISSCYYYNSSTYVTKALVQQAKDYQRKVSLWTIDSETHYKEYASYGVNYVTSNSLKLKDIADLDGTDPNVSYTPGITKTIYYRPSTTDFAKGYTNLTTKGEEGGWSNVYWTKNSRVSASVHGPYKANIYLDYAKTKTHADLTSTPSSRFIPIAVPDGYTGVITYRLKANDATEANYKTWKYSSAGAGITNSNTVPKFTNSAQIPTPEKIPTDGKNLLCNKEGWWDVWYWAYYLPKNNGVSMYFANIDQWENVQLLTGKDIYTHPTNPTTATIPGTKLAYFNLNDNEYGYLQYGFIGNGANWDATKTIPVVGGTESQWVYDENSDFENNRTTAAENSNSNQNRIVNRIKYANNRTGLKENLLQGVNLYTPGTTNDADLTHQPLASYAHINHTQTFIAEAGGKVAAATYKLTGANSTTEQTKAATAGTFSLEAAYTATTTVTATPEVGYTFDGWYLNGNKVSSELTYTFDAPNKSQTLTARFLLGAKKKVRAQAFLYDSTNDKWNWINSNDGGTFSITHSGGTVYNHTVVGFQDNLTFTLNPATFEATPNSGYHFIGWWNNTKGVFADNPWTMVNPADYDQSVTARFAPLYTQTYHTTNAGGMITVNYNNGQAGLGTQNTEEVFTTTGAIRTLPNEPISIIATPKPGYKFTGWYEGSTRISVSAGYQYHADSDKEITARFEEELLAQPGNLRLKYVEQTAISKTLIEEDYFIYSDEITKDVAGTETVVSMHIYNKIKEPLTDKYEGINNPEIILQQYDGSKWVDIEAHMVFGPLQIKEGGSVIKLPGRKNAGDGSEIDDFVYDTGIKAILDDPTDNGCGVWNFVVVQDGTSATIDIDRTHRYTGNYYIRAESADGGYDYYAQKSHHLTYSDYAYNNYGNTHDFSHYFCDNVPAGGNVKFTIACDNNSALAYPLQITNDRFADDEYGTDVYVTNQGGEPVLPTLASVRYSWDIVTNRLTRAYIAETKPSLGNEYLVIDGASLASTETNYPYFYDNTNWVYSIDVDYKLDAKAQVKAKYNGKYQYFWGNESIGLAFIHSDGSDNTSLTYPVRIVYDFKEHRFSTIYKPTDVISGTIDLAIPVMILREHNDPATQIVFNSNAKVTAEGDGKYAYSYPAYGVLTFLEDKFATDATTTNHYEKMFYWVSFPFDVNIDDVVGLGEYEGYWAVQFYNGPKRALQCLPDGSTGWEYVQKGETLKANVGYVVCLNYRRLTMDYGFTAGQGRKLSLYFPSASKVSPTDVKNQANITVTLDDHPRGEKVAWNHWNWHLLGVPSYANPGFKTTQGDVPFFYQYWHPTDGYAAVASTEVDFYAMHSYMVQYAGEIEWSKIVNTAPSSLAAKKNSSTIDKTTLRLELQQAGQTVDKTYVQLREEEGTEGFDLNLDLTKIINKGANIYTVVHGDQMAGNVVPKEATTLPLGVVITEAGEYTFSMPQGTSGMIVELVDYLTGTRTNLLLDDYTVTLTAGSYEGRFALSMEPNKVVTDVEDIMGGSNDTNVRKLLIDGALYMQKDGVLYDAQGHAIQ